MLYFDNLSGDTELDWLRNGLTDMLVTDLSQSPDLRVLSTDRLYQLLSDLDKLEERQTSFETVSAVAEAAKADTVILGSFAKLGDTIRISYKIQEAGSGEIVKAQSVDANVQEELFARVDDLSRDIRQSLELPEQPATVADRDLSDVSTSAVEAYRLYVAAEELHFQFKEQEALELYLEAVEIDPAFAMALAKVSTVSGNLGLTQQSLEYGERAMEHLDRLTEPERAYIEGRYYSRKLDTIGKAIETYSKALENYPHITSLSNNLGIRYAQVGMHPEAIRTHEQGIRYGDVFPGTYGSLADSYAVMGNLDRAHEVIDDYLERFPANFSLRGSKVDLLMREGRLDEAAAVLAEAESMRPTHFPFHFARFTLSLLQEDWQAAEKVAASPSVHVSGALRPGCLALHVDRDRDLSTGRCRTSSAGPRRRWQAFPRLDPREPNPVRAGPTACCRSATRKKRSSSLVRPAPMHLATRRTSRLTGPRSWRSRRSARSGEPICCSRSSRSGCRRSPDLGGRRHHALDSR